MSGRRHLLLIAYYFPPWGMGGVQRPLKFAKYLPQYDWDVTVIAPSPGAYHAQDPSLLEDLPHSVVVHRIESRLTDRLKGRVQSRSGSSQGITIVPLVRGIQQLLRWPDDKRRFARAAVQLADGAWSGQGYDAVLTTSPPPSIHLAGMAIQRRRNIPWVADFRDPWLVRSDDWGPTVLHRAYARRLRRTMLNSASVVIATSDATAMELRAKPAGEPAWLIPNGYDEDDFAQPPPAVTGPATTIALYGTLSPNTSPEHLLGIFGAYRDRHPGVAMRIRHIGGEAGTGGAMLAAACGLSDVFESTGYLPHRAAIAELLSADVVALSMSSNRALAGTIPGRTFEALRSLKPILLCAPRAGALARLLGEFDGIHQFDPGNARSGMTAVEHVMSHARDIPARAVSSIERFNRRRQTGKLAEILNAVTKSTPQVNRA